MQYGKFERKIAKILDRYPSTRKLAKLTYQRFSYMICRRRGFTIEINSRVSIRSILGRNRNNVEAFFGYYDKSPWSFDNKYYLVHVYNQDDSSKVDISTYNCETGELRITGRAEAFNFQQGAMLRWLNKESRNCIFNTVENSNLVAKVKDAVSGKEIKTIPMPVQTVNDEGTEALTLNYRRLDKIRPEYGYRVSVKNFDPDMPYEKDGIWRINISTGRCELITSLAELIDLNYNQNMDKSQHKVNHLMYSPSGKRFVFMHRWIGPYGKFSRLYTANADGSDIYCLANDRMISHYYWMDDKHLIAFARKEPIGDRYFLIEDKSKEFKIIGDGVLDIYGDGHPQVHPGKRWLVTDTYPNKGRIRELILFNLETEKRIVIASFFAPWKYDGYYRCDLHPRWSPDGNKISIDSAHEGFRNSYIIDVTEIISNG